MKKIIFLSSALILSSSFTANAGNHFSFGFFAPAPVYVVPPQPIYYIRQEPTVYRYYYPAYDYQHNNHRHRRKNNWKHEQAEREWYYFK